MAIYVPASRRRRSQLMVAGAVLVVGLVLGGLAGRATAPTVDDRISSVRAEAREIAAGLRVVSLHEQAGAPSLGAEGDGGAALAVARARERLGHAFGRAPWLPASARTELLRGLDRLTTYARSAAFATEIEAVADKILETFGAS